MFIRTTPTVKTTKYHYPVAVLISLILLLPCLTVQAAAPSQPALFKTTGSSNLTVDITRPLAGAFYFNDRLVRSGTNKTTFVYGGITIAANVSGINISRVVLLVNGKEFANASVTTNGSVSFSWAPKSSLNGLSIKHILKVIVYDTMGDNASANITVMKWRFHVLPFVILGLAMMPAIIPKTTIRGIVFNIHKVHMGYTFFAIKVHYKSNSLLKRQSGSIFMKRVHVGPALSLRMFNVSPLKLARISGTFLGMFK